MRRYLFCSEVSASLEARGDDIRNNCVNAAVVYVHSSQHLMRVDIFLRHQRLGLWPCRSGLYVCLEGLQTKTFIIATKSSQAVCKQEGPRNAVAASVLTMNIFIFGIIVFILLKFANAAASRAKHGGGAVRLGYVVPLIHPASTHIQPSSCNNSLCSPTMGNCCSGGESKTDNFSGTGRTLGSAPARPAKATASLPAGRTTGGAPAPARAPGSTLGGSEGEDDAKAAAARAAEVGDLPLTSSSFNLLGH